MIIRRVSMWLGVVVCLIVANGSAAQIFLDPVITSSDGLSEPLFVTGTGIPGDDRLFVLERDGRLQVWLGNSFAPNPFLDLSTNARTPPNAVDVEGEGGLLGLVFSSDYANDGRFYVYYTVGDPQVADDLVSRVSRFLVMGDPRTSNVADPTEFILPPFPVAQTSRFHNGGTVDIWGDHLYVALGDGGGGSENGAPAQDDSSLFGKMLRFDLTQEPPTPEVVAKGLRNPYRFSIDPPTGDVYIGDVGTSIREEIDVIPNAALVGVPLGQEAPLNFGWPIEEGTFCRPPLPGMLLCGDPSLIPPIFEYDNNGGGSAVVGGVVYRGSIQSLRGEYFLADILSGEFWGLRWNSVDGLVGAVVPRADLFIPSSGSINFLAAIGSDTAGELYVVDRSREVYRLVPEPSRLTLAAVSLVAVGAVVSIRRSREEAIHLG